MSNSVRLVAAVGLVALAILAVAIGLARDTAALLAPANLIVFALGIALYLLPTALAIYRNCAATKWIAALNILLGWTVFGWFAAIGWAASGKIRLAPLSAPTPPIHPVPGH
jgi:hypothetical protein